MQLPFGKWYYLGPINSSEHSAQIGGNLASKKDKLIRKIEKRTNMEELIAIEDRQ